MILLTPMCDDIKKKEGGHDETRAAGNETVESSEMIYRSSK